MRDQKPDTVKKEQELLEDIHRTEEEIDHFLERKKQEAELILRNASQQSENLRVQITREALEEKDRLREQLISNAETKAGEILEEGALAVERIREHLDESRASVTEKIVDFILGRK